MKIKTSKLTGAALDWAVAKLERPDSEAHGGVVWLGTKRPFSPSASWADGGPILEREGVAIDCLREDGRVVGWVAALPPDFDIHEAEDFYAPIPLIAAMRCYVASKLGDEVEIPEELLK